MAFTQNFNYCMEQKNYSAYKFAQIIGASNQGVLNWQTGVSIPYPKTKQKIANHFGISVAELDGDELPVLPEQKESVPDPKIEGARPQVKALFDFIDTATDQELDELVRYAQYLISKR